MKLKLCLIGCGGFSADVHGPAHMSYAATHPGVELAACCDLDAKRAQDYALRFGYRRVYTDAERMLEQEAPDAVFVLVMPRVSAAVASVVLRRGIPLFLEKPPGMTGREIETLSALAREHQVPSQVAFNRRYMPIMQAARRILDERFPSVLQVNYHMIRYNRADPDFSVTAIHAIDAAQFLAGSPYRQASLRFEYKVGVEASRSNVTVLAETASGTAVNIHIQPMAGLVSESFTVHGVGMSLSGSVYGPGGQANSGFLEHWIGDRLVSSHTDEGLERPVRMGIHAEVEAFCEAVRQGGPMTPSLEECQSQVRLMEAIRNRETGNLTFTLPREMPATRYPQNIAT
ncbi:MAG: Gfo/Idh/MocA family oxidoreductase [Verrucomicrobiota bacterium JB024]|nr:Gfo/Idh/MocA family oxidoreductase [Verrucomicrobiota bacterium JB024]